MASLRTSMTTQLAWTLGQDGDGDTYFVQTAAPSAPGTYNHSTTLWQSNLRGGSGSGTELIVFPVPADSRTVMLKCFGTPASNPAGYVPPPPPPPPPSNDMYFGIGAIWGVSQLSLLGVDPQDEYLGDFLGRFDITVGNDEVASSGILPTSPAAAFGRRATIRVDRAIFPGLRPVGQGGEASPLVVLDTAGYAHMIVELRCALPADTGTTAQQRGVGSPVRLPADNLGFAYRFA